MTAIDSDPVRTEPDTRLARIVVAREDTSGGWEALGWAEADCVAGPPGRRLVLCRVYRGYAPGATMPPHPAFATLELFDPEFAGQIRQVRQRLGAERVDVA